MLTTSNHICTSQMQAGAAGYAQRRWNVGSGLLGYSLCPEAAGGLRVCFALTCADLPHIQSTFSEELAPQDIF